MEGHRKAAKFQPRGLFQREERVRMENRKITFSTKFDNMNM